MSPIGQCGGIELYARIPDSAPDLQGLAIGVLIGVPIGWATFLFWWFFWKNHG
jgi:hypothetical protein